MRDLPLGPRWLIFAAFHSALLKMTAVKCQSLSVSAVQCAEETFDLFDYHRIITFKPTESRRPYLLS